MTSDLALLKDYAENRIQASFTALVKRHVDLVYSAALRQVRSPQLAEEVAQSVFTDLARNANKLKPDTVLTAWLYQVTRRTAIDVIRRESRRQLRDQVAAEMNAMNATAQDWIHIEPLLDEAMEALDETDRTAVLLRYFENQSLREVGNQLGISDDAAQKRVSRAVDRLRDFLAKRDLKIGVSGLVAVVSVNAVQTAPAALAVTITSAAAIVGTTAATVAATTTKVIAMTTLQKTLIGTTLAVVAGAGIYEARQASKLGAEVRALEQQQAPLTAHVEHLSEALTASSNQVAGLREENERLNQNTPELLRLRGEAARLQRQMQEARASVQDQTRRATEADQKLAAAESELETARPIVAQARFEAGEAEAINYVKQVTLGYTKFAYENQQRFPSDLTQLDSYVPSTNALAYAMGQLEFLDWRVPNLRSDFPTAIVVRERIPRQSPLGQWRRLYGLADGSVHIASSADGNFLAWETEHTLIPNTIQE